MLWARAAPPDTPPPAALDDVPFLFQSGAMEHSTDSYTMPQSLRCDAAALTRGISRLFARNDSWCLAEMPLRNGRRADLMGLDPKGQIVIVEIKVSRADLLGDSKWPDYLDYCDKFYWGVPPDLDRSPLMGDAFLPEHSGIIVADGYDAEIIRPAALQPLASARRKMQTEQLARTALRRQLVAADPACAAWRAQAGQ